MFANTSAHAKQLIWSESCLSLKLMVKTNCSKMKFVKICERKIKLTIPANFMEDKLCIGENKESNCYRLITV
jgi:hypothetical protein